MAGAEGAEKLGQGILSHRGLNVVRQGRHRPDEDCATLARAPAFSTSSATMPSSRDSDAAAAPLSSPPTMACAMPSRSAMARLTLRSPIWRRTCSIRWRDSATAASRRATRLL